MVYPATRMEERSLRLLQEHSNQGQARLYRRLQAERAESRLSLASLGNRACPVSVLSQCAYGQFVNVACSCGHLKGNHHD